MSTTRKQPVKRLASIVGTLLIWMFLALVALILSLHLPSVQDVVADKAAAYLTAKTGGPLEIDKLRFTIFGRVRLKGLRARDPAGVQILELGSLSTKVRLPGLLLNHVDLVELHLADVDGLLEDDGEQLNIQYFIDAFSAREPKPDIAPKPFAISTDHLSLQNIVFRMVTPGNSLSVESDTIITDQLSMHLVPNTISLRKLTIAGSRVTLVSVREIADTAQATHVNTIDSLPALDLGTGFAIKAGALVTRNVAVDIHEGEVTTPLQFTPAHIVLRGLGMSIADIVISEPQIQASVDSITADVASVGQLNMSTEVAADKQQLTLSELQVSFSNSELNATLQARYNDWRQIPQELEQVTGNMQVSAATGIDDLSRILPDSLLGPIAEWQKIGFDLALEGDRNRLILQEGSIRSGDSYASFSGSAQNVLSGISEMTWQGLSLESGLGESFMSTVAFYTDSTGLPDSVEIALSSEGRLDRFAIEALASTSWGIVESEGVVGLDDEAVVLDLFVDGQEIALAEISEVDWLGRGNINIHVKGSVGPANDLSIDGTASDIDFFGQQIRIIDLSSSLREDSAALAATIRDTLIAAALEASVSLANPLEVGGILQIDSIAPGVLFGGDTTLVFDGAFSYGVIADSGELRAHVDGRDLRLNSSNLAGRADSLIVQTVLLPDSTAIVVLSDLVEAECTANFAIADLDALADTLFEDNFTQRNLSGTGFGNHQLTFALHIPDSALSNVDSTGVVTFGGLRMDAVLDISAAEFEGSVKGGSFDGFGLQFDTLSADLNSDTDQLQSNLLLRSLAYDSILLGDLTIMIGNSERRAVTDLALTRDSSVLFGLATGIRRRSSDIRVTVDSIAVMDKGFYPIGESVVLIDSQTVRFDNFAVAHGKTELNISGTPDSLKAGLDGAVLRDIDKLLLIDSNIINSGLLTAAIQYHKASKTIDVDLEIDSLKFYDTPALNTRLVAHSEKDKVPFDLFVNNNTNTIQAAGYYKWEPSSLEATLELDINNLETFKFLTSEVLEDLSGSISGDARITGPVAALSYSGDLNMLDMRVTTLEPRTTIGIRDESIRFANSSIAFNDFTVYDEFDNPFTVNGALDFYNTRKYQFELDLSTDNYVLINNPSSQEYLLQGLFVMGTDMRIEGDQSDVNVDASLIVRDTTNITYTLPERELDLITGVGIVEFADPSEEIDSINIERQGLFMDTLMQSLPDVNLDANLRLEKGAMFRIVVDPRSGDYIEASGTADIDFAFDRTKNVSINGSYEIENGHYQLYFYDLVKKKFEILEGSNIQWSGRPEEGSLDITATHQVRTSSVALLGDEIGENETSLYRRSLPYIVSILIKGTMDEPEVSFALDLPKDVRANYPALSSKLNRLSQPEYESELNKQVFGLLVLGGFIPATSTSEFDEMAVATTAIANSVNSLLAAQLNKLTNQIRGIDINVGLQSYTDYQQGGGRTRTAVDFRVSKSVLNDRLSFEVGGAVDLDSDQSGANTGADNFRSDITVIYDLTESGNKQLKLFNNETYDIIYHEVRNTGIALIFIREFDRGERKQKDREDE